MLKLHEYFMSIKALARFGDSGELQIKGGMVGGGQNTLLRCESLNKALGPQFMVNTCSMEVIGAGG